MSQLPEAPDHLLAYTRDGEMVGRIERRRCSCFVIVPPNNMGPCRRLRFDTFQEAKAYLRERGAREWD